MQSGNTGFQSGHNSIPSSASEYTPSTSIGEILDFEDVIIYPNPSEKGQKINIRSGKVFEEIQLIDISGKLLLKIRLDDLESNPVLSKNLEAGSYSLRLISPSFTITKKILILNN